MLGFMLVHLVFKICVYIWDIGSCVFMSTLRKVKNSPRKHILQLVFEREEVHEVHIHCDVWTCLTYED
jgi:hypothetical protein